MLLKIYVSIWVAGFLAVGLFYITGNLTPVAQLVFGFLSFGAVFMGMIGVLPETVVHDSIKSH